MCVSGGSPSGRGTTQYRPAPAPSTATRNYKRESSSGGLPPASAPAGFHAPQHALNTFLLRHNIHRLPLAIAVPGVRY